MSEFDLIRDYFHWQDMPASVHVGVGDDAAILGIPVGHELVVSVDTFNEGVHFPPETPPHAVGYKALAVNLSDLAAMGAKPAWFTLAISMPKADPVWLAEFARGMRELAQRDGIALVGGDTTRGALSMTIQVMGLVKHGQGLLRSKAQDGDLICVTGTLGDAAAGLAVVQGRLALPTEVASYCVQRLNYPTPRNVLADVLGQYAHACMDISDGLLADLGHVMSASQCGANLSCGKLPFSSALMALPENQRREFALTGGDDYELLFTLPENALFTVQKICLQHGVQVSVIGQMNNSLHGLFMDHQLSDKRRGYDHFPQNTS